MKQTESSQRSDKHAPIRVRRIGRIVAVTGAHAIVLLDAVQDLPARPSRKGRKSARCSRSTRSPLWRSRSFRR